MRVTLLWALPTAVLAMAVLAAARVNSEPAHARRGVPVSTGGIAGKVEYCTDCHGPSGQGYHGYLTMPRLAGQTPEYIDKQLSQLQNWVGAVNYWVLRADF